jgi:SAM-dependent methyltransferase
MINKITWEEAVLWLRAQSDRKELVRDCFFDEPLIEAAKRYASSAEWQATHRILPAENGRALDLGAGRGISSHALALAGWHVEALEPDASKIVGRGAIQQLANESILPIYPLEGFAENIPSEDDHYDLVYGRQVMHHAQSLQKMCNEIARVLKRGGTFIATREHVISKREDLPAFLANHPLHSLYGGENAFLLSDYLDAIKNAGLVVKSILGPYDTPINYFPMTEEEWREQTRDIFVKRIGEQAAQLLLSDSVPWSRMIRRVFSSYKSRCNQTPGRLYTFVARKP